ncbi:MAG: hypothetical protein PSX37_11710, partial [bacterium]|nr:hypothetical protein [bacterium]
WYTLRYQTNSPTGASGGYVAKWTNRTVLAAPGMLTSYTFDNAGQLLAVAKTENDPMGSGGLGATWVSAIERDAMGGVVTVRTPAAVSAYSPSTTGDAAFFTAGAGGLRYTVERISSGLFAGFVRGVKHQASGSDPAFFDSWVSYLQEAEPTLGWRNVGAVGDGYSLVRPLLAASRGYSSEQTGASGGSAKTTEFEYSFHASEPLAVELRTHRDPAVSAAEHGPGGAGLEVRSAIVLDGETVFERSRTGRIHFFDIDPETGLTVRTIQDANTEATDLAGVTIPDGFATDENAIGILHRVRTFEYDEMGRLVSSVAPDGRQNVSHFAAMGDGRVIALDVPLVVEGAFHGPATATVYGHGGELWATMLVGPALNEETGFEASTTTPPGEWLNAASTDVLGAVIGPASGVRGDFVTLQRSASGGVVLGSRLYHTLPSSGEGVVDTNYDPTVFGYDSNGRLNRIEDPTRTIEAFEFDTLGRLVRHRRGTDDGSS